MTLLVLSWVAFLCAFVPALLYLWNSFLFREPPADATVSLPPVSVLIPARNEELGIEACVRSVLASEHVELEVIVLDDASTDRTADIVRAIASEDPRLRLELAPPLPPGWSGKQHACSALSKLARFDTFTFLDADVRLHPDALARMCLFQRASRADLVSGFPWQETVTLLEKLLIPLINWLLLCWLPLWAMRHFRWSAFGAGCGQWFLTSRAAYEKVGGHAAVKASFHDGLQLPRAYRRAGFWTDVCDATHLATCRMYRSNAAVWLGLAKNAREGMAATGQIGFWTVVLLCGQTFPFINLTESAIRWLFRGFPRTYAPGPETERQIAADGFAFILSAIALSFVILPRLSAKRQFRQPLSGVLLHPVAVVLLLAVQWYAVFRAAVGHPIGWKGRAAPEEKP